MTERVRVRIKGGIYAGMEGYAQVPFVSSFVEVRCPNETFQIHRAQIEVLEEASYIVPDPDE